MPVPVQSGGIMIYGINYDAPAIPDSYRRRFAREMRLVDLASGKRTTALLSGVCDTKEEMDSMLIVASNGSRKLHVESRAMAGKTEAFGIYVYWN